MAVNNATVLNNVWLQGSNDYQQRIPYATKDTIASTVENLLDPRNADLWNQFVNNMITLVGTQYVNQLVWKNPFAILKRDYFVNGKAHQEIGLDLVTADAYDQDDTAAILRNKRIDPKVVTYNVNRRDRYQVTLNEQMLRQSFVNGLTDNGSELANFIAATINAVIVSDRYDEYRHVLNAFAAANLRFPFYNENVDFVDPENPTANEIKTLSRKIKTIAGQMQVAPTGRFNALNVKQVTNKNDLIFITTPARVASMQVDVLADAFNMSQVEFQERMILVDELPWAGAWGILCDRRAVVLGDQILMMNAHYNEATLTTNHFLHHHQGIAVSPMQNCVVFSNQPTTTIGVVDVEVTGITAKLVDASGNDTSYVRPGRTATLVVRGEGSVTNDDDDVFSIPSNWVAEVTTPAGARVSGATYVDRLGVLHVDDTVADGTQLLIKVTSAYYDPSADYNEWTTSYEATVSFTVGEGSAPLPPLANLLSAASSESSPGTVLVSTTSAVGGAEKFAFKSESGTWEETDDYTVVDGNLYSVTPTTALVDGDVYLVRVQRVEGTTTRTSNSLVFTA